MIALAFFGMSSSICFGQVQHSPKHYVGEDGRLYWNKSEPVYLFVSPVPDKPGHRLKSKTTEKYADPMYLDAEGLNYIRSKYAVDPETRVQVSPQTEIYYEIYADGIPPKTTVSLAKSSSSKRDGILYFGPGLEVSFSSTDLTSGVENIFFGTNGGKYVVFNDSPIALKNEGSYAYSYYAVDNVGNAEASNEKNFVLDITPPFTNLNINGLGKDNVISESSTMYFLISDSLSGVKNTFFKYDAGPMLPYEGGKLSVSALDDGSHTISYYSIDNVKNVEESRTFDFYLDKSAPLMVSDVLGDKFIVDKKVYFSGRTKLKLTAIDNKIGVKDIMYSIDGSEFKKYNQPFYLPSISGNHEISYYSVDKLDNRSNNAKSSGGYETFKHNVSKVYIDLTGPTLKKPTFKGLSTYKSDTLLIGPNSKINLSAYDPESGLKEITYSLNDQVVENSYDTAFTIIEEGIHKIEYFGYDNVNNRNKGAVTVFVDATPPEIYAHFTHGELRKRSDGHPVYPNEVGLFLAATDQRAGLSKIFYSINGQAEQFYDNMIFNFRDNFDFELRVRTLDLLGNESRKTLYFSTAAK